MPPVEYHLLQRYVGRWGRDGWWRPVVGIPFLLALFFLFAPLFVYGLASVVLGQSPVDLADTGDVRPTTLLVLNIALGSAIGSAMLVSYVVHGLRPGWLNSVVGRMRWRWLATCLGLSVVALAATLLVSMVLPAGTDSGQVSGEVNAWTTEVRDFLLVIVLLTPLQAAGEEYAFRGYLTQAFGGIFSRLSPNAARAGAVLLPSVLFALAHGAQDPPVFVDRLAFGIVAGVLVIATGGLEAGIAMHVLNNFVAYGLALAFSDMTSALNPTGGTWWSLPTTLTQSLVYLGVVVYAARRMGIATTADRPPTPSVLEGSQPRV